MKTIKCDICGSDKEVSTCRLPVYRLHDGCDGLIRYEHPKVHLMDIDICPECLSKCTNIYDDTVMGYGKIGIIQNPELKQHNEEPEKTSIKISPFTGGKVSLCSREEELTYRGEKIKINRQYYRCEDTGREFSDSKLDDDMMWAVFRAYCEKKGLESFKDLEILN